MRRVFSRSTGDDPGRGRAAMAMLFAALMLLVLTTAGGPAFAHAALIGAAPADGAVLEAAPESFRLQFNEPVSPTRLALIATDGTDRPFEQIGIDGATITIAAPADLPHGSYGLTWRVISADGHPVSGTLLFSIGASGAAPAPISVGVDRPLRAAIWAMRVLIYAGLFIGVGGVFFSRWIGGRTGQGDRVMVGAILGGLVAAAVSLGLQGLDMLGKPLAGLLAPAPWAAALTSSYAATVALAGIALLAALAALRGVAARPLSALGLVGIGLALTASGHVATAPPHWLTRPAIFVHGIMIAFWIGALIPLLALYARPASDAGRVLARFSRLIPGAVLLLVGAGIAMARVQLAGPQALTGTAYGRVFLVKLGLLGLLFTLAAINRFWLTDPVARGEAGAIARFRRSVGLELVLVLAILATVALWRFTPPPRALAAAEAAHVHASHTAHDIDAGPAMLHIEAGGNMVMVHVEPDHAGPVAAEVYVYDMAGDPVPAQEVTLTLANPDAGIEPIRRRIAAPDDFDAWHVEGLILPAPGNWSVRVEALISDFEQLTAEGVLAISR